MPKFEVKSMPPVPATAEGLPIELDGISMVRFVATEDRLGPPLTLTAPVTVHQK